MKYLQLSGHGVYDTKYHICWGTKYGHPILSNILKKGLVRYELRNILKEIPECQILKSSVQDDHIHLLMVIPPKYAVSAVVGRMKGKTSSMLRKRFSSFKKVYWTENVVWQPGYFARTVGANERIVKSYIKNQDIGL